ncbi:unnamed protein product [Fraxinus pennsylvanica]|uniref:WPP domain-containing protein n=1 Tax=Fraxinus pennsylvanica TaxID=56036 RepID=A0AAD1ZM65_9LAMI|nr:unnamed protein product [Fraxinus pennsylvanica]
MAEAEQAQQQPGFTSTTQKFSNVSFNIWPPTDRTRDTVRNRLIETLSFPSILSKCYGIVPSEEATDVATRIEKEAFLSAVGVATTDNDGFKILQVYSKEISKRMLLQVYSKEISKRMLDTVKSRSDEAEPESKPVEEPEVESKTEEQNEEEDMGSTAPPQSEKIESVVDDE